MALHRFTILGCGSSGGVPRLGGNWGACDPANPKNRRQRCSLLVQRFDGDKITTVLIDSSPDMRAQLLAADIGHLDGVVYTHQHADHVHGLDDLRMIVFNRKKRLNIWADGPTQESLISRFGYAFIQPENSPYPPILDLKTIDGPVEITGEGGAITLAPFKVGHGSIDSLGFRIGNLAYLPDVAEMYAESWAAVQNLEVWILDALRYTAHPTHTHFDQSIEWIKKAAPASAVLTNMHIDLDYKVVCETTPENVTAAFDGMQIELDVPDR